MHRVVPELIVENYRAGCYSGEFASVGMFLDLSGFSTMTDVLMQHGQHGAEVLAGLMHDVFDPLVESVFDYGGKIVGFAGDGIMALYPVEEEVKSTALHALTSAFVIQKRLAENPIHQTVYGKFSISAKIGLAVGSVSWGILRSDTDDQATYYFRGSAVEESADAEHHAKSGDILLTDGLRTILRDDIDTTPRNGFQRLKTFSAPLADVKRIAFPPVDLSVARLFLPEEVIANDVRGEFRQVVNLFLRFPDLAEYQLQELMGKVFALRNKYGGLLTRLDFGDKGCNMLMLWGAPVAYENDVGRAVNFLLDLKAQVDFSITAGITYYIAHAGYLGSALCEDYTCYGWGVNLASRFMMSAADGEIWVDDRIARRVSKRFAIEFIGSQLFKGFASEQKVHCLLGRKQILEPMYQGELVGREPELAQLADFIAPLWRNEFAGLLLVSGDAGIGKGRLVYEFRSSREFDDKKILWAVCQSDQILRQSLNPFRSWLFNYFETSPGQSLEARRQSFDARFDDLLASLPDLTLTRELDRTRSVLGALLDVRWDGSFYEQLDAEGRYNNTFLALINLLKAESLRQPVVLFLEDLQFTDKDSRDFLPRLKRAILASEESCPIAIIVTTRPDSAMSFDADLINAHIHLRGLSYEAIGHLADTMLGGPTSPSLVTLFSSRSEGNPYFVEQILRYLQEENLLETSETGWALVKRLREDFLPGDIRSILVARLDQLTHRVKEIIQTASVLGREFEVRVLSKMLSEVDNIPAHIAEAEKAAIWSPLNEMRYLFSHGLLRDAAYEMQMQARRRELHGLALEALEHLYADDLNSHYAELAYHAEHAEHRGKAQNYYALAGRVSTDLYQNSQGVNYYTRALAHTLSDELVTQYSLLVERAELFNRLGDRASQFKDLDALERLAQQLDDVRLLAEVHMLLAHYYISIGNYQAVVQNAELVIRLNQMLEDTQIVLDTYRVWPLALLRQGKLEEAMTVAERGRQLAQLQGEPIKEGYILNAMGLIAIEQNNPVIAHAYLEQALAIAREAGDSRLQSRSLSNLGNSAGFIRQDYAAAREYFEEGYLLAHERGERPAEAVSLGNLGWVAGMQGDFASARSYHERALLLSREVGNPYLETTTLINLSSIAGIVSEAQSSLQYAQEALALSRAAGDRSSEAWAFLYMGYAYLLLNDFHLAGASFEQAMAIREELGQLGMKMEALAGMVQTFLLKDDLHAAGSEAEKIVSYLQSGGLLEGTEEPLRIYYACYLALEKLGDSRAPDILNVAAQLLESQMSKLREEASRQMYVQNVPWRLAIWQAASDYFTGTSRSAGRLHSM